MKCGKAATLRQFIDMLASVGVGDVLEIGECFDADKGWRVYLRAGDAVMLHGAREVRVIADLFDEYARRMDCGEREWARDNAKTLRACALSIVRKNRAGVVPDGYLQAMPTVGSA